MARALGLGPRDSEFESRRSDHSMLYENLKATDCSPRPFRAEFVLLRFFGLVNAFSPMISWYWVGFWLFA